MFFLERSLHINTRWVSVGLLQRGIRFYDRCREYKGLSERRDALEIVSAVLLGTALIIVLFLLLKRCQDVLLAVVFLNLNSEVASYMSIVK